ncbi:hypothetical protein BIV57_17985 [Mangrovactinospora gilvigrisea]|uniref:Uncharacterized protein n=1 Tax=Mangrovactinospora gilvigrisea TaxID=1428644 RepID=A0A1J7C3L0_9ACTN|nr:hypothetical protein [Mangrovactinospora gilvigrisea]OIV36128.1 hypothetical protein BIV57_17985 [Mangrovactinospora gilvigrisea]
MDTTIQTRVGGGEGHRAFLVRFVCAYHGGEGTIVVLAPDAEAVSGTVLELGGCRMEAVKVVEVTDLLTFLLAMDADGFIVF